uniref:Uncharacterized protein n=1 Tax=Micrococcus phage Kurnik TaxID=3092208 RepID=A0AAU6R673_9CAUD
MAEWVPPLITIVAPIVGGTLLATVPSLREAVKEMFFTLLDELRIETPSQRRHRKGRAAVEAYRASLVDYFKDKSKRRWEAFVEWDQRYIDLVGPRHLPPAKVIGIGPGRMLHVERADELGRKYTTKHRSPSGGTVYKMPLEQQPLHRTRAETLWDDIKKQWYEKQDFSDGTSSVRYLTAAEASDIGEMDIVRTMDGHGRVVRMRVENI